jgi:GNAT superfamily N-acetyltransferase
MKAFLSQELAERIEIADAAGNAAYIEAQREVQPETNAEYRQLAGGTLLFAGPGSPVNRAVALGFAPLSSEQLLEIENWFLTRQCAIRLEVCPFVSSELIDRLAAARYHLVSFKNVWALSLEDLQIPEASLDVREIQANERELWSQTAGRGFASSEEQAEQDVLIARPMSFSKETKCFLAFINGEAAGGAALSVRDKLAFLFGMGTRVAFRRKGIQTALLHCRLREAKDLGCELAIVHTTPTNTNSQRNVERLGFKLLYTNITLGI